MANSAYAASGVDTEAGDRAVQLMRASIARTHGSEVIGGFGGFAGLFDASEIRKYRNPVLATSTDGVGTKVAIAQAIDKHDTVGQDLVAMVIDDIVVCGARTLFMTDYIACGKLQPERIAEIVGGISSCCEVQRVALLGGETAEHPGLMAADEYDLAGAAVGVVERDQLLSGERIQAGDVAIGVAASGLHANGFSLVRKIVADRKLDYRSLVPEFPNRSLGEELLVPTAVYSKAMLELLASHETAGEIRAFSHITGGGISDNLSRVLPEWAIIMIDRASWSPPSVFRTLAQWGGVKLSDVEATWNLGLGFAVFCSAKGAPAIQTKLSELGFESWPLGQVDRAASPNRTPSKGSVGGRAELFGNFPQ